MVRIREDKGRSEARTRSKKSEKGRPFNLCIQRLDGFDDARPRSLPVTRSPPSEHRALLSERLEQ